MGEEDKIPAFVFRLGGKTVTYNFAEEVQIDSDNLNAALRTQPSKFAFVATASAAYQGAVEGAKAKMDLEDAKLDGIIREQMTTAGEKITEGNVKARIDSHARHIAIHKEYMELSQISRQLQAAVESFRQRMQMLISLANNYRADLDMNLFSKKTEYEQLISGKQSKSKH